MTEQNYVLVHSLKLWAKGIKGCNDFKTFTLLLLGSPFHPKVVDARKVKVVGGWQHFMDSNDRVHLLVDEEKRIPFDVSEAGPGKTQDFYGLIRFSYEKMSSGIPRRTLQDAVLVPLYLSGYMPSILKSISQDKLIQM